VRRGAARVRRSRVQDEPHVGLLRRDAPARRRVQAAARLPTRPLPPRPVQLDAGAHAHTEARAALSSARAERSTRPPSAAQLHSIAAYYPDSPTDEQQQAAAQFLRAFPLLYPCKDCAHDLQIAMASTPPRLGSRAEFSLWMCELHNHVNEQVGKAPVPCDLRALDEAWRTPSKECERAQAELAISAAQ